MIPIHEPRLKIVPAYIANSKDKPAIDANLGIQVTKKYKDANAMKSANHNCKVESRRSGVNNEETEGFSTFVILRSGKSDNLARFILLKIALTFTNAPFGCLFNKKSRDSAKKKNIKGNVISVAMPAT